ncbi:DUF4386 domain-containing protein [Gloeocapsopsis crepidinum LEGE 06123]|uniref:DUF4386 domain-containing protein n=1 Tax=Gloeocapsopsis crepidinum LEGE 06123 TaxID=588587 RepID=A0ABR9ULU9_9CHRO|nr:DUF4386 domain-containing protein [Gloeocapsopsis crepidinum]MBE9189262.1 DUF4386 domain-containing protein [Gloeocapsopsis crepidinum LEGE 06123]
MNRLQLVRITGILLILFAVLLNVPYYLLAQTFEYDDILRQPTVKVLTSFHTGGTGLILTWFAFALLALLFIPASVLLHQVLRRKDTPYLAAITLMGVLSALLQSIGLMRWVFVIPILANLYVDPDASTTTREATIVVYQAVHQYGGVVIGEQLGQLLLAFWTLGVGFVMLKSALFKSWVAWLGIFTVPLWILGQSELLATVIPSMPTWEVTPISFTIWGVWLFVVGIFLLGATYGRGQKLGLKVG